MLGKQKWLSICLVVALTTIGLSASAFADSGSEQGFLTKINAERAAAGLGSVSMDAGLQDWARTHTGRMIANGGIYHSSSAELKAAAGSGWSALGENVGRGGSVNSLHSAFMKSTGHCKNVLGGYNKVGIGTAKDSSGILYVTVVFMNKGGSSAHAQGLCPGGAGSGGGTTTTTTPQTTTTSGGSSETTSPPKPSPKKTTTTTAPTTTTTIPPTTTTTLIVGPDKPVTPGQSCFTATMFWWMCHS